MLGKQKKKPSHTLFQNRGDNRSKSVLHDEPVFCNSSQVLLIGILLTENKHVLYPENPVGEFLSHPGDTTIDTQATTTGLTQEEHSAHNKWRRGDEYQNTKRKTPLLQH